MEKENITLEEYNKEIDEAEAAIARGEFYTHEEVTEMSKTWIRIPGQPINQISTSRK